MNKMPFYYSNYSGEISRTQLLGYKKAELYTTDYVVTTRGSKRLTELYRVRDKIYISNNGNVVIRIKYKSQYVELIGLQNWRIADMLDNSVAMQKVTHIFDGFIIKKRQKVLYINAYAFIYLGSIIANICSYRIEQDRYTNRLFVISNGRYIWTDYTDSDKLFEDLTNFLESEEGVKYVEKY